MSKIMDSADTVNMNHTDVNLRIALRVRLLRGQRALSLDALSTRSHVSRSMISLIERGESSPTAAILDRIAVGLGVPLAALFDESQPSSRPLSTRADRHVWRDPESGYVRCNISPPGHNHSFRIVEVSLPARAHVTYENGPDLALHQQVWVQQGRVDVTVGQQVHRLSQDDCLAMQLDRPTAFRNPGSRVARYIVVIAATQSRTARA
jgi:transcriptional regulator with XRE-family HTH domain